MRPLRVVGVADTDSYVKWTAALLGGAPPEWETSLVVLETPLVVSDRQLASALSGSGTDAATAVRRTLAEFEASLVADPPDAVVIGARGPLVRVVARAVAASAPSAVITTGLPGVAIPATRRALVYRAQCDLFVVHSHRERRAFRAVAAEAGFAQEFALATLPFAARRGTNSTETSANDQPTPHFGLSAPESVESGPTTARDDLVFAAQALVPRERADRMRLARLLVRAANTDPSRRVVLKVRGTATEAQTHAEADALPDLIAKLGPTPPNLVVSHVAMHRALDTAAGLVTISSTAAIEAVARGIPVIALDTFGVSRPLINEVFEGSGMFGDEDDVVARRFRHPDAAWLTDDYLHDPADDDWAEQVASLVALRRAGRLPQRPPFARRGGRARDAWERRLVLGSADRSTAGMLAYGVGVPLRAGVRVAQRLRRLGSVPAAAESTAAALGRAR